jgi:hypothetical protein
MKIFMNCEIAFVVAAASIGYSTITAAQKQIAPTQTRILPIPPVAPPLTGVTTIPIPTQALPPVAAPAPSATVPPSLPPRREYGDGECTLSQRTCSDQICSPPSQESQSYRQCVMLNCSIKEENCIDALIKRIRDKIQKRQSESHHN